MALASKDWAPHGPAPPLRERIIISFAALVSSLLGKMPHRSTHTLYCQRSRILKRDANRKILRLFVLSAAPERPHFIASQHIQTKRAKQHPLISGAFNLICPSKWQRKCNSPCACFVLRECRKTGVVLSYLSAEGMKSANLLCTLHSNPIDMWNDDTHLVLFFDTPSALSLVLYSK
jgi:hypothetical protein